MSAKDDLVNYLSRKPDFDPNLVTGVAMGQVPPSDDKKGRQVGQPVPVILVEPVADCELESLNRVIQRIAPGALLLRTGRFVGLISRVHSGDSISPRDPSRFNLPPACAGTLGARVVAAGAGYGLSSNHLLALNGRARLDTSVVYPGTLDDPSGGNELGSVAHFVDMEPAGWPFWSPNTKANEVDCALATITSSDVEATTPVTLFTGDLENGMGVNKKGRTTGDTQGTIWLSDCATHIDFDFATCYFDHLFGTFGPQPFAAPGDSGALVLTDGGEQGLGLVTARAYSFDPFGDFAGYFVLMCRLDSVAKALAKEMNLNESDLAFFR